MNVGTIIVKESNMKKCILILFSIIIFQSEMFSVSTYTIVFPNSTIVICSPGDTLKFYGNGPGNFVVNISNATGTVSAFWNACTTPPYYIGYSIAQFGTWMYLISDPATNCTGTITCGIIINNGTGIFDNYLDEVRINTFPNPTQDELSISFNFEDAEIQSGKVQILNNIGQIIREEEISFKNKNATINTNDLPNGVYFLNLKNKNSLINSSKRFIISK